MLTRKLIEEKYTDKGLKPTTAKTYTTNLLSVIKRLTGETNTDVLQSDTSKWFNIEMFNEKFSKLKPTTIRNYISCVISWMLANNETCNPLFKELSNMRDTLHKTYEDGVAAGKSETEVAGWMEGSHIAKQFESQIIPILNRYNLIHKSKPMSVKYSDVDNAEFLKIRDIIIVSFYLIPFCEDSGNFGVLRNDITTFVYVPLKSNAKAFKESKEFNSFITTPSTGRLSMVMYKTDSSHGAISIPLPDIINTVFRKWAVFSQVKVGTLLFPDLTRNAVSCILLKYTKKYLGKSVSTQLLRKMYVTYRFSEDKNDRQEVANNMMHSTGVQDTIYNKG